MEKICNKCFILKPLELFHKHNKAKDGRFKYCKECDKKRYNEWRKKNPEKRAFYARKDLLKNHHGLTPQDYQRMVDEQHNKCFICHQPPTITSDPRTRNLQVDHCHKTREVRKLLCHLCNRAIGLLKEDIQIMMNAIEYIKVHKS